MKRNTSCLSAIPPNTLVPYLRRFSRGHVLVIGDLMLDHYIWGAVSRISPEAPVPIVHVERESLRLGGAANVYNNVLSLGGQAEVCGVIGDDETGKLLLKELGSQRRLPPGIVLDASRPTTRKARIVAHSQQVVRYDVEQRQDISQSIARRILKHVDTRLNAISCIVISDYAKGVITPSLMEHVGRLARSRNIPIIVDPKVDHFPFYAGVTVITPNHTEAQQAAGLSGHDHDAIHDIGHLLRQKLGCEAVLVTRGEQGMSLCESHGSSLHIPTMARQVYDVTGAGDTVVSTLALAMSVGASIQDASILANYAAGVVVGQVGTASITRAQLKEAIQHSHE
ncbi:D-glycero-beta-D-manno-heptose-7-phosphate kinase [Candidatus Nitronereus thalassa]|uniref:D-glycero-beta-D-manno-heptose-7-phosphate kinase n=1 Tax=Candidatus Nitronereus thalassa TaxID=3020898 RepID=A0ABU3K427_9BACT|nr:D-glycero-beta-D-manno-heptose-7-phosphate kinase [Candidatus Nitronereus thalassa]MDT7041133.1 D-glycero-beta-D-manno-heptose-7-phosphate kinase [Candidatus Nitronereus thalassa]